MKLSRLSLILAATFFSISVLAQQNTVETTVMENPAGDSFSEKFYLSYFMMGGLSQQQIEEGSSSYSAYNYIGFNYRLSKTTRFSVRPVFYWNTAGNDNRGRYVKSDNSLGDLHIVYADYEFANVGGWNFSLSNKFYLPTSEYSQTTNMVMKYRPETFISHDVGRFNSVTYVLKPDLFWQEGTSYEDTTTPKRADGSYRFNPYKTTQIAKLEHYVEFNWSLSQAFSIKPSFGFEDAWYNRARDKGLDGSHRTNGKLALGFDVRPLKKVSLLFSFENKPYLTGLRGKAVQWLRPEDSGLVLIANASL